MQEFGLIKENVWEHSMLSVVHIKQINLIKQSTKS